jgi:hypothetical protein
MRGFLIRGSVAIVGLLAVCISAETACSSKSSGSSGDAGILPAAGGTGAFGIVTVNGIQKMYLPLQAGDPTTGNGLLAVVNVGLPGAGTTGAPALITNIDLGSADYATATGGDSNVVVAASTTSSKIWFINPQNDTLTKTIDLGPTAGRSSFSGGGGFVTGIAIDAANHRAILSVWNGFALVDLNTQTVTSTILAPPSENFGFDSSHERIFAPFYECSSSTDPNGTPPTTCNQALGPDGVTVMTSGLSVIDLNDNNTVYTYEDANATDPSGNPAPNAPLGSDPDSAAADPTTQQVVIPAEHDNYENILDFSKAVFDKTKKTVTAPHITIQNISLEGVAVEYNTHLAFFEGEGSDQVAVTSLSSIPTVANTVADGGEPQAALSTPLATMPDLPAAGGGWSNLGDPHGIAVTTGLASGHAVGFVVSGDYHWVARIDLAAMAQIPVLDAGDTQTVPITQAQMTPVVTFLDATKKP